MKALIGSRLPSLALVFPLVLPLLLLPSPGRATSADPADPAWRKLDPVLRREVLAEKQAAATQSPAAWCPSVLGSQGNLRHPCWIRLETGQELPAGLNARRYGLNLAAARLTDREIEQLLGERSVLSIEVARRLQPSLDLSRSEIQADIVQIPSGDPPSYGGYTGLGVVVGIVDTGLDLDHLDFENGGDTRVALVWDQTVATAHPPSGYAYGVEWTQADIDSGSAVEADEDGHGTHVAGIAAGNGAATGNGQPAYRYVGVAPEAILIAVKTDFYSSSIADAVSYVFGKAASWGLPAVVNLSLGSQYGPHDGTGATDLAIDNLCGPGYVVVAAAGNEQESGIHAEAAVDAGSSEAITFVIPSYSPTGGSGNDFLLFDGYYTNGQTLELTLTTPGGTQVGPITAGNTADTGTPDGWVILENDVFDPYTDDKNIFLQIYDQTSTTPPAPGTWTLTIENTTSGFPSSVAQVDIWLYNHSLSSPPMFDQGMTSTKLVASPASADSAIAVSGYVTRTNWTSIDTHQYGYSPPPTLGDIAPFSNHGPRRDGVIKPDIAAPGMGIAAALSTSSTVSDVWIVEDGVHTIKQGTSMAAPHVTGVVALMLQSSGFASKHQILERLAGSARPDAFTGAVPNTIWGAGKIDALGAVENPTPILVLQVTALRELDGIHLNWEVPDDSSGLYFDVSRQIGTADPQPVDQVGPGPRYSFTDEPLLDFPDVSYWLTPIESGRATGLLGPYRADWPAGTPRTSPAFSLSHPAPNPFSTSTRWILTLPAAGAVRGEVLDPAGRRVQSLSRDFPSAGAYTLQWDGRTDRGDLASSGIYWFRCAWNGQSLVERVMLLRRQ